ncbi:MAG: prolyl oligopeptidase family serine peptidase [Elusimicrobia bacterium]|nr:prolyl oligopeptidase family serine peptidase [Elusimicrobiota bacterium]
MRLYRPVVAALALAISQAPWGRCAQVRLLSDLPLASVCGSDIAVDLAVPEASPDARLPVLLFVHGGGWEEGGKEEMRGCMLGAAETGFFVGASVNYRLTSRPEPGDSAADAVQVGAAWPLQRHDLECAIRWLRGAAAQLPELRMNGRVGGVGHSAGGQLVQRLAVERGAGRLDAATSWAGPSDLYRLFQQVPELRPTLAALVGAPPREHRAAYQDASPALLASPESAPIQLIHGLDDRLVAPSQSRLMHRALIRAGAESELLLVPGGHGFTPESFLTVWRATLDFQGRKLHGAPGSRRPTSRGPSRAAPGAGGR